MYMYMDPCTSTCAGGHVNEAVDWICNFRLGNVYIHIQEIGRLYKTGVTQTQKCILPNLLL